MNGGRERDGLLVVVGTEGTGLDPSGWPSLGRVPIAEGTTPRVRVGAPPPTPPLASGNRLADWSTLGDWWDDPKGR